MMIRSSESCMGRDGDGAYPRCKDEDVLDDVQRADAAQD